MYHLCVLSLNRRRMFKIPILACTPMFKIPIPACTPCLKYPSLRALVYFVFPNGVLDEFRSWCPRDTK